MASLSKRILVFAVLFWLFLIFPGLVTAPFPGFPLLQWADIVDLLTPFAIIPAYALLFHRLGSPGSGERMLFLCLAILWAGGHGIHLAANAIGHLTGDLEGTAVHEVTYFLDERLSHYLWLGAVLGFSALLCHRQRLAPESGESSLRLEGAAAVLYGFTYFCVLIEGQAAPLCLPYALGLVIWSFAVGRGRWRRVPVVAFFALAHGLALGLTGLWAARWKGLPEFSAVGIIS